jgi:protein O-mannosyl-transferase
MPWWRADWCFGVVLLTFLTVAYFPAWNGQPIWDDDGHLTKPELQSWCGLTRIWIEPGATQQYYPLTHTVFWIAHKLWGDSMIGYHFLSILLHWISALILLRILRILEIPGARLAAALFALHPVQVESVAWISELKNTLSGLFYLSAALVYLRFSFKNRERPPILYALALGLFILGLLSKTVIATLPAALLLIFWWKRGIISWRRDCFPLIPFVALGMISGLVTAWVERKFIGAEGVDFGFSLFERILISGRAYLFYLGKIIWPDKLIFIYPRWTINQTVWWQYLFSAAVLGLVASLWLLRNKSRGSFVASLLFGVTLFPALGFINIYPFLYSFVADHFQYIACIAPLTLAAAGISVGLKTWRVRATAPCCAALLILLSFLTWQQSKMYANVETLWRTTIDRNPECWMAFNNLGSVLTQKGNSDEAIQCFKRALQIRSDDYEAHNNLGLELDRKGLIKDALGHIHEALRIKPGYAAAHNNLGIILQKRGDLDEAISNYQKALVSRPSLPDARFNLGMAYLQKGLPAMALPQFEWVIRNNPGDAEAECKLGLALQQQGKPQESLYHFRKALEIKPGYIEATGDLGIALFQNGQPSDAILLIQRALKTDFSAAQSNPDLIRTLTAAYAQVGRN